MIKAEVNNCNNIVSAKIHIRKNHLNIRYAMNGIGKSTIASAINLFSQNEDLSALKAFGSETEPTCKLSETVNTVLLFNEDFVDRFVFQQSEVIENAFEVFIKTPEYEERKRSIDQRLNNLRVDLSQNADIQQIVSTGRAVLSRFSLTIAGQLKKTGLMKSLTSSESIFALPEKLTKFQPLMDKEYMVDWVGWKNEGSNYDDNQICPFCTDGLPEEYQTEKELFASSYAKSNVKNITEMLSYFLALEDFMEAGKKERLHECIKGTRKEDIDHWVTLFYLDLQFLLDKITGIEEFNSFQVAKDDLPHLGERLKKLFIDIVGLQIFNNQKTKELIDCINQSVKSVLDETESLKSDIGELKGLVGSAKSKAITDINDFLFSAGISYVFDITDESESVSKTILKYVSRTSDPIEVDNIRMHLSWGERNAFALVLFMHHALSQNADIIILDDPISSFDSQKKYAIINRLFSKDSNRKSFYRRTVLMLTHDLQPIIDFIMIQKPTGAFVNAYYLQNKEGLVSEQEISRTDIRSLPKLLAENSRNEQFNTIHRVASLRKLLEHMPNGVEAQDLAYQLLSCLIHGKTKPDRNGTQLTDEQIKSGEELIRQYIPDFEYTAYSTNIFTRDYLLKTFNEQDNSYLLLQVFRVLLEVLDLRAKIQDDALLKYIDEQFHVENDYVFSLDLVKYDLVPDFVIPKCLEFLKREGLIT